MVEVLGDGLKVRSDDSGRFVIRDVHESAVIRLRATAEGLAPAHAVAYPGSPVTIALERGTEILGRVITASGAPVLGARIRCFSTVHEGGRYQLIDLHAVTNAEGTFRIAGVRRSTEARLQIDAPSVGKARITVAPERLAGDRFDVGDVVPIGGFSVTGTLTDSQGAPLPGLTIHLLQQPGPPGWSEWSTTSKDGTFDFRDLPPGRYRISTSLGAVSAIETIDLGGEAVRNVALRLAATRALRVVVVDENGSGVAGVTVDVRFPDLRSSTTQSTGDDGVAEIRFDRARPDRVSVSGDDGAGRPIVPAAPTFPVVGDEMRIPVRRGSRVHGQVVDVQGRPVPGAQLRAVRDGEVLGETWADTTGDFLIVVPRRDATIVTATGFARVLTGGGGYVDADQAWVGSAPVHPEASVAVRVEVRPATRQHVTARLQLHDGRGTPLGGVPLIATRGEQRRVEYDRRTTDGAGIAMFDLPGEGLYRFLAAGAATDEGFSMTVPAEEEAVWRLPADRSLVGSVVPVVGGMTGRVRLEKDGREVAAADVTPEGSFVLISAYPIRGSAELRLTVTYRGGEPSEFRRWVTVPEPSRVVLVAR